jgi:hypothetical protein
MLRFDVACIVHCPGKREATDGRIAVTGKVPGSYFTTIIGSWLESCMLFSNFYPENRLARSRLMVSVRFDVLTG